MSVSKVTNLIYLTVRKKLIIKQIILQVSLCCLAEDCALEIILIYCQWSRITKQCYMKNANALIMILYRKSMKISLIHRWIVNDRTAANHSKTLLRKCISNIWNSFILINGSIINRMDSWLVYAFFFVHSRVFKMYCFLYFLVETAQILINQRQI